MVWFYTGLSIHEIAILSIWMQQKRGVPVLTELTDAHLSYPNSGTAGDL
ncbi:MAG: hypothetical protein WBP40_00960 [Candidatus Moraniibacteriota bacterium]